MQITWFLPVKLSTYAKDHYSVVFPVINRCPCCQAGVRLTRHGFYQRNVLLEANEFRINICRYFCPSCRRTVSLLPHFLLPYFQHTREVLLKSLQETLLRLSPQSLGRQIAAFYRQRFLFNLPAIINALREQHWREVLPLDENSKAIKVVERLIFTPLKVTTSKVNLNNRVLANFMALSF